MGVTIYDIAGQLGISAATVSRVLNSRNDSLISEATRARVISAAKQMGYKPNTMARALVTGKTYNIALFAEDMQERTGPHFARMLEAMEPKARELGYRMVVCGELESVLSSGMVDGVVLLASSHPKLTSKFDHIARIFVYSSPDIVTNSVCWNDLEGTCMALDYLCSLGHRSIVGILGDIRPEMEEHSPKVVGFRRAMEKSGLHWRELIGTRSTDQFENGYLLTKELLADPGDVTALFARNDFIALGAMKAIMETGMSIPDDISIVGYNDTILARCVYPGLTSVHTPIAEAGVIAVEHLIRSMEGNQEEFAGAILPISLAVRDSCAPPKK
ncbi:LacI family transcriptional regulator [bacterium]|nr:LacI family transcriptional regulator [bacterium]